MYLLHTLLLTYLRVSTVCWEADIQRCEYAFAEPWSILRKSAAYHSNLRQHSADRSVYFQLRRPDVDRLQAELHRGDAGLWRADPALCRPAESRDHVAALPEQLSAWHRLHVESYSSGRSQSPAAVHRRRLQHWITYQVMFCIGDNWRCQRFQQLSAVV